MADTSELLSVMTKLEALIQTDPRKFTLTVYRYENDCVCQLMGDHSVPYVVRHKDLVTALSLVTEKLPALT